MDAAFASGRIADLLLGLMLAEGVALSVVHVLNGRGIALTRLAPMLAAGASLVLALRGALLDAGSAHIGLFLGCAGIAHAVDVGLRWRDSRMRAAKLSQELGRRESGLGEP